VIVHDPLPRALDRGRTRLTDGLRSRALLRSSVEALEPNLVRSESNGRIRQNYSPIQFLLSNAGRSGSRQKNES